MFGLTRRGAIGLVLLVVGVVGFVPAAFPETALSMELLAVAATALLTIGTYLVGTDVDGRPA